MVEQYNRQQPPPNGCRLAVFCYLAFSRSDRKLAGLVFENRSKEKKSPLMRLLRRIAGFRRFRRSIGILGRFFFIDGRDKLF